MSDNLGGITGNVGVGLPSPEFITGAEFGTTTVILEPYLLLKREGLVWALVLRGSSSRIYSTGDYVENFPAQLCLATVKKQLKVELPDQLEKLRVHELVPAACESIAGALDPAAVV